ncbi:MAG: GNAT family N-acetyltransferase [Candidatus Omnitrophica bacterium]|nr:GNAT family N-acetyltransferase [Candidatus Omnitrophota bacterium]
MIEKATLDDVKSLVNLHQQAFTGLFSTRLGPEYLTFFYESIITSDFSGSFVYKQEDAVMGFIAGTCDRSKIFGMKNKIRVWRFVIRNFLLFRIGIREIIGFIFYAVWSAKLSGKAELLSFVVDRDYRCHGIGSELLKMLLDYYRDRGISNFVVFSDDKESNGISFYLKRGFRVLSRLRQKGYNVFCLRRDR